MICSRCRVYRPIDELDRLLFYQNFKIINKNEIIKPIDFFKKSENYSKVIGGIPAVFNQPCQSTLSKISFCKNTS